MSILRINVKKTPLTLGSALNRKRCFHSYEPEWPLPASQVSNRVLFQKGEHKGSRQKLQMEPEASHMLQSVRCERQPGRVMLHVNKGEERKEAIIMKGSTQSEQKWPANILPYGEALSFPLMACWFCSTVWVFLCSNLLAPSWSCHHSVPPPDLLSVTRHSWAVSHGTEWKKEGRVETVVVLPFCNRSNCLICRNVVPCM